MVQLAVDDGEFTTSRRAQHKLRKAISKVNPVNFAEPLEHLPLVPMAPTSEDRYGGKEQIFGEGASMQLPRKEGRSKVESDTDRSTPRFSGKEFTLALRGSVRIEEIVARG